MNPQEMPPTSTTVSAVDGHKVAPLSVMSRDDLRRIQLEDPTVGFVLRARERGERPSSDLLKGKSLEARLLMQRWDKLQVAEGVLWRHFEDDRGGDTWMQLIIPRALRNQLLEELHAGVVGGHLGEEKVFCQLKKRFYWPGYSRSVRDWCRTCATCVTIGSLKGPRTVPHSTLSKRVIRCRLWQ